MERNENDSLELKVIQLTADTYAIQHQSIIAPMKTVKIGEDLFIIYSNTVDPVIYPARLLDIWQEGNVLYLKLWNCQKNEMQIYLQDLNKDECLFLFVSIPFITQLIKIMTDKSYPEISHEVLTKTN
ncbi:MAG: hypothetical protein JW870_10215 [Candidatus Delongbacteria bacterium]|nr:hypothetical protein [Candidatus Delongbacteria bacterium]